MRKCSRPILRCIAITTRRFTDSPQASPGSQDSNSAASLERSEVRAARPERGFHRRRSDLNADRPQGYTFDTERCGAATLDVLTVFLTGSECPYTCVFCDLWQYTLLGPTPRGAIPRQLRWLGEQFEHEQAGAASVLKLYNASNFFDPRAVPEADDRSIQQAIGQLRLSNGARVVVECHPKILCGTRGRARLANYVQQLDALDCKLEVAFGLETVAEGALSMLAKGADLDDFARAFEVTLAAGAAVRAFVLYGIPTHPVAIDPSPAPADRQAEWTLETLAWAKRQGAQTASVIPVRSGNGALEQLAANARWSPPELSGLVSVFERALKLQSRVPRFDVHLDTWELDAVSSGTFGHEEAESARRRLRQLNETGTANP